MKSTICAASFLACAALLGSCMSGVRQIDVETLISEVAAGESFEGAELVVSGLALGSRDPSGMVNLGSDDNMGFISVYGVKQPSIIHEGMALAFNVRVQRTFAVHSGSGEPVVMVNMMYQDCVSCKR